MATTPKGEAAVRDLGSGRPPESKFVASSQAAASPVGGTGAAAGGWDTAGNRDIAITTINNNRTRIAEIETALKALGILS